MHFVFFVFASDLKLKQNNSKTKPLIYPHFTQIKHLNSHKDEDRQTLKCKESLPNAGLDSRTTPPLLVPPAAAGLEANAQGRSALSPAATLGSGSWKQNERKQEPRAASGAGPPICGRRPRAASRAFCCPAS